MRREPVWALLAQLLILVVAASISLSDGCASQAVQVMAGPIVAGEELPPVLIPTAVSDAVGAGVQQNASAIMASSPYMRYRVHGGNVVTDLEMPPTRPNGMGDYAAIFAKHNICFLLNSGQIDEVWIWAGNGDGQDKPHLLEWTTSGPDWIGNTPNCGKIVTTLTYNYTREVDVALETFHHRLEGLFMHYVPCDFSTANWPWEGLRVWPSRCAGLLSDRYGFVAPPFAGNDFMGGCGDAHAPPNILDDQAYNYKSLLSVRSNCPDWSQDGSANVSTLSCQDWGCSHGGYHIWWMQNLPGPDNTNRDRNGQTHINWWTHMFGTPGVPSTPTALPTATLVPSPGPSATPTVSPTPTVAPLAIFSDDFAQGADPLWLRQGGAWSAEQGEYRQTDRAAYDTFTWVSGAACRDTAVQVRMRLLSGAPGGDFAYAAGPVLGLQDTANLHLADLTNVAQEARIYQRVQADWVQLASIPFPVDLDRWYDLQFSNKDGLLNFYVDGALVLEARTSQPAPGATGLRADRAIAAFDDFRVLCRDSISATPTATDTASPTVVPSSTPTAVSTARLPLTYLPLVLRRTEPPPPDAAQAWSDETRLATMPESPPGQSLLLSGGFLSADLSGNGVEGRRSASIEPVVYVIYYPGYGTPRANVTDLTQELIGFLEKGTIYQGYRYAPPLRASFLGQDGANYAGRDCTKGDVPDNIHIRITGMRTDVQAENYRVEDPVGAGAWASPCTATWLLHTLSSAPGTADLHFKPFRDAPDGTVYTIAVRYSDGSVQTTAVAGTRVKP